MAKEGKRMKYIDKKLSKRVRDRANRIRASQPKVSKEFVEKPKIDMGSWFYKNCKIQRRKGAKICQVCPFRKIIEEQEAGVEVEK